MSRGIAERDSSQDVGVRRREVLQFTKEPFFENTEPRKLESIQFSTLSETEIQTLGEVDVCRPVFYDSQKKPLPNGLLDPKMGPANKFAKCATCHGRFEDCPGHYGCLNLALPVFNNGYFGAILEILKCICKSCSRVLLEEKVHTEFLKKMRNPKLDSWRKDELKKKIVKKCSVPSGKEKKCWRCGYRNGSVKKENSLFMIVHDVPRKSDGDQRKYKEMAENLKLPNLDPVQVLSLFKRMPDQDCELLYLYDRPEKLLLKNIPVPPVAIRPSVFVDGGSQSNENDTTMGLRLIIRENACLQDQLQGVSSNLTLQWQNLQTVVALYINSEAHVHPRLKTTLPQKPSSGFVQRLKGKHGRFRGNLSGKRVQYTGRTVISPDPNLKITQVGIPIDMALLLTYPESVTHHNIEKLRQCVRNGPGKYPGAKFLTLPNGDTCDLKYRKRAADELMFGSVVHRHLEEGDVVLFNRQPSLHRMSIMCHRAKVMQWKTLRFNESVCNPYNADFDGDEMNLHVPQTEEARAEALMLMGVQNNLCTPKNGEILVASTQDFLTCAFLITRKDTFYDRAAFSLMCSYMGDAMDHFDLPTPAVIKPMELWTGKQLFHVLLRPNAGMRVYVNLMVKEKVYSRRDETMCQNDGFVYFRNSELISGQLGKATLGSGNKIGLYAVLLRDYNAHAAGACMNRLAKLSARWIGNHGFSIGIDDVQPGDVLNKRKMETISKCYDECGELIRSYDAGKLPPMPGCDAAQTLEDKIFRKLNAIRDNTSKVCMEELEWRNSPLIMSQCGSKGSPLNITQMIALAGQQDVEGRRVPDGFIDRSLPHFPMNSKTPPAKGFVASSFYTGLAATEFFFHTMGGRVGLVDTAVKTADTGYMSRRLVKALEDLALFYDMTVRNASGTVVQFLYGDDGKDPAQMEGAEGFPLDFTRLLVKAQATCPSGKSAMLSPAQAKEKTERWLSDHEKPEGSHSQRNVDNDEGWSHASKKLSEFIATAVDKDEWCMTEQQLEMFLGACISRLCSKRMEAGTAIGVIGAQSIGEPGTQMTLKTFHFAGVAGMNITLGIPRVVEIINAVKKIRTPIIKAKFEDDENLEIAKVISGRIEKTFLGEVAESVKTKMTNEYAYLAVKLDMKKIKDLQLSIDNIQDKLSQFLENTRRAYIRSLPKAKRRDTFVNLCVKVKNEQKLHVIAQADRDHLQFVLARLKKVPMVLVKGISTVKRAIIAKEKGAQGKEDEKKMELFVEGTGLLTVMGIEGIQGCKTKSNDINEVYRTIGIEAARSSIIDEIKQVMDNMNIDVRHMMLLADVMTYKGEVLAITRGGISKMKDSALMLASFEKSADHLFNASRTGKYESIEGVCECIIMGVPMKLGTGMLKVMQRAQKLPVLNYQPDPILS